MDHWLGAAQIAAHTGIGLRTIQRRLRSVDGGRDRLLGKGREWPISTLPAEWQVLIELKLQDEERADGAAVSDRPLPEEQKVSAIADPGGGAGAIELASVAVLEEPSGGCDDADGRGDGGSDLVESVANFGGDLDGCGDAGCLSGGGSSAGDLDFAAAHGMGVGEDASIYIDLGVEEDHPGAARERQVDAWLYLLAIQQIWCERNGFRNCVACDAAFAAEYNLGRIEVPQWMRDAVRRLSRTTLARKRSINQREGVEALARKNGRRKTSLEMGEPQRLFVLGMLAQYPHCTPVQIYEGLLARFEGEVGFGVRSLQRWIAGWKAENASVWRAWQNPDKWRGEYMTAFGSRSEGIERLYQLLEADSTPADLLLEDGRYSILGLIDAYSRTLKFLVSKTSRAASLALLLRSWCLEKGVPETIRTDNGKDYLSHHFRRCLAALEIEHKICAPFRGDQKPYIERALGTFNHDLLPLLEGYAGHNVAARQDIRAQRSFAERLATKGEVIEVKGLTAEALQRFCDDWAEIYNHRPHAGMGGQTPAEKLSNWINGVRRIENERALDILLAAAPGDGLRTVSKKGLRLDGGLFIAPELGNYVRQQVAVRYDPRDLGRIYVFTPEGQQFICVAECPERTGVSRVEVQAKARQVQQEAVREGRALLREAKQKSKVGDIAQEIVESRLSAIANVVAFPGAVEAHETAALTAAAEAVEFEDLQATEPVRDLRKEAEMIAEIESREQQERARREQAVDLDELTTDLVEAWRQGRGDGVSAEVITRAIHYLRGHNGEALLMFLFAEQEERWAFEDWLAGLPIAL